MSDFERLYPTSTETPAATENPYGSPQALPGTDSSYVTELGEHLNPWISIWTKPRATIRQIVNTDPNYMVLPLAALGGVVHAIDNASSRNLGDHTTLPMILGIVLVVGPFGGLFSIYLFGAMLRWTGSWLGGVATAQQVRAAFAWGRLPGICMLAGWVPLIARFGNRMFISDMDATPDDNSFLAAVLGFMLASVVLGVWQIVLVIKCVAEVHEFSSGRAFGALCLAGLVLFVLVAIPVVLVLVGNDAFG